ncbi:MAG: flagellar FliJ family protein [Bacteroidetes bacterium]|nr:flagellar FliJ family protein [Bacteroidota bacterium]MCL5738239.1 flagellar FliJ family protein [Bacteroidota bacterium]
MAKFNFRLQAVIKVKEIQEKKIQRELAQIKKRILQEQAHLEDLEGERERMVSSSPLNGKVRAADAAMHQDYIRKISDEIHFENARLENLAEFETKKIDEVLDVKKDKEAIEHLKEKRLEEYRRELDHKEQILLDAVAQRLGS